MAPANGPLSTLQFVAIDVSPDAIANRWTPGSACTGGATPCARLLRTMVVREKEIRSREGPWYAVCAMP